MACVALSQDLDSQALAESVSLLPVAASNLGLCTGPLLWSGSGTNLHSLLEKQSHAAIALGFSLHGREVQELFRDSGEWYHGPVSTQLEQADISLPSHWP